jgi:hypothetical protein
MSVDDRLIARGEASESASGFRWFTWSFSNGFCRLSLVFRTGGQASELAARVLPSMS